MTQSQLHHAVARSTGESLRTVRRLGFHTAAAAALEPEELRLAVDCPFCGHACVLTASLTASVPLAECDPCDVVFNLESDDVYATAAA